MKSKQVTMVRIYLTEAERLLKPIIRILHDEEKVCGVTAFRGIMGFGRSGAVHGADLIDISMNLPLVVEFFDEPQRVEHALQRLNELIQPGHMVTWQAQMITGN